MAGRAVSDKSGNNTHVIPREGGLSRPASCETAYTLHQPPAPHLMPDLSPFRQTPGRCPEQGTLLKALYSLALLFCLNTPTQAANIVVDVERAEIITADAPDALRRPASLVKLMTAYLAFETLENGQINGDDEIEISAKAARTPPVKLYLKAGRSLSFEEILHAAIVGSKNDAAVAVAEAIADTEQDFVTRMNATAANLGMTNTKYASASGLPRKNQYTTARDTAILALALLTDFPDRSALFKQRSVTAAGKTVSTTNPLFGRVEGAQGMKTGFTCAAGYNIAGLIERAGRRTLIVTLGHKTKFKRLAAVKSLLRNNTSAPETREKLTPGNPKDGAVPDIGACTGDSVEVIAIKKITPEEIRAIQRLASSQPAKPRPPARKATRIAPPQPILPKAPPPPPPLNGWAAFLGPFGTETQARGIAKIVLRLASAEGRFPISVINRISDDRPASLIYGLDRAQATALCSLVKQKGRYCVTLAPAVLLNPKARWRR